MTMDAAPINLQGKTCIVTGAGGGIGLSLVEHFLTLGARVFATDLSAQLPDSKIVRCYSEQLVYQPFDLLSDDSLRASCAWVHATAPDVLINNAAVFDMGSVLQTDLAQYDRLFSVNVRAVFALMQSAAKSMVEHSKPGSIINMASQAGHRGEALVAHYCATKAAIISYTQSAALALAPYKIRVNAISPGVIDTPMWKQVDALFAQFENKQPGQKKHEAGAAVPLGYMGSPADVSRAAVFLAGDQSAYMTAQTICVDGGNVLR